MRLLTSTSLAGATAPITNLGRPTNDAPGQGYLPLGGFRRTSVHLQRSSRAEVLWVGITHYDPSSAIEAWPLVKALDQFGAWSGLRPVDRHCTASPLGPPGARGCTDPTLDLSHAAYRSRWVAFVYRAFDWTTLVRTGRFRVRGALTEPEKRVLDEYMRAGRAQTAQGWVSTLAGPTTPVLAIGDYEQRDLGNLVTGELYDGSPNGAPTASGVEHPLGGLPFAKVLASLQMGHAADSTVGADMVQDINAEANVIVTLICHADNSQPHRVCSRTVVRSISRHVR